MPIVHAFVLWYSVLTACVCECVFSGRNHPFKTRNNSNVYFVQFNIWYFFFVFVLQFRVSTRLIYRRITKAACTTDVQDRHLSKPHTNTHQLNRHNLHFIIMIFFFCFQYNFENIIIIISICQIFQLCMCVFLSKFCENDRMQPDWINQAMAKSNGKINF